MVPKFAISCAPIRLWAIQPFDLVRAIAGTLISAPWRADAWKPLASAGWVASKTARTRIPSDFSPTEETAPAVEWPV